MLLRDEKISEADSTAGIALAATPGSAPLLTALSEVQHRQGLPWQEQKTLIAAEQIDPCYAPLHLQLADLSGFTSNWASAATELRQAHALDPCNPQIHRGWMETDTPHPAAHHGAAKADG